MSKSGELAQNDGALKLARAIKASMGPQLEQDVAKELGEYNNRRGRYRGESMASYIADESRLYEKALRALNK